MKELFFISVEKLGFCLYGPGTLSEETQSYKKMLTKQTFNSFRYLLQVESQLCPVTDSSHLAQHPPHLSMWLYVGGFLSFLSLNNILLCIYVCVCVLVTQSCPALCNHMDCSLPGFSVPRILQARMLEQVAISFSSIYVYIPYFLYPSTYHLFPYLDYCE